MGTRLLTMDIRCERVYDWTPEDGTFPVLVDRLWPRGVKKERLAGVQWDKDIAPSADLRKDFHSGALGFEEFSGRYTDELEGSDAGQKLLARTKEAGASVVVLLYASKDKKENHALVLADYLRGL